MKINDHLLDTITFYNIMIILTVLCIGPICITYSIVKLKVFSYYINFLGLSSIILYIIHKIKTKELSTLEKMIIIILILSTMSIFGSEHLKISIFGFYNRYEGLLMLYSYYSFALLASTIKEKKWVEIIIVAILVIGLLNVIYGLFQTGFIPFKIFPIMDTWKYAKGFLGNSMNYALLMSLCYFLSLGIFLEYKNIHIIIRIILLLLFSIGNVISGSMSILVTTIIVSMIVIVIKLKESINIKNMLKIGVGIGLFLLCFSIFMNKSNIYGRDVKELLTEVNYIVSNKKIESNFGTGRMNIWENTLKESTKHMLFGVGVDNFYYAFTPRLVDKKSGLQVDKAHNDYLQKLLCEGVFSLSAYILFLIGIVKKNYKQKDNSKRILLLGFIAYAICVSINISVIRVAPLFWIITGILMSNYEKTSE